MTCSMRLVYVTPDVLVLELFDKPSGVAIYIRMQHNIKPNIAQRTIYHSVSRIVGWTLTNRKTIEVHKFEHRLEE